MHQMESSAAVYVNDEAIVNLHVSQASRASSPCEHLSAAARKPSESHPAEPCQPVEPWAAIIIVFRH